MKRAIVLLAVLALLTSLCACGTPAAPGEVTPGDTGGAEETPAAQGDQNYTSYTYYFDNDTETIHTWGADATSKYWKEKFKVDIQFSRADADPESKLNLMIASKDLPDLIYMNQSNRIFKMIELGLFQPINPLAEKYPEFYDYVSETRRAMISDENGQFYLISHWPRTQATGGGICYMVNKRIWEDCGSPKLNTLEAMYDYCVKAKELGANREGLSIIPFMTGVNTDGGSVLEAFYRAYGGPNRTNGWWVRLKGKLQLVFRDPKCREALLKANEWWRAGLMSQTQFSDNDDQIIEKLVSARNALIYYGADADDYNHFRHLVAENFEGDDFLIQTDPIFVPAGGLSPEDIYASHMEDFGYYGTYITTLCENPDPFFQLVVHKMSKQGSVEMMYGPQGELWDELDADGIPLLKLPESQTPTAEKERVGCWMWSFNSSSDNVDNIKFAMDARLPKDQQNFGVAAQRDLFTPINILTNEYCRCYESIESTSDLGIARRLCEEEIKGTVPKIIMAASQAEAGKLYDELVAFCDANQMPEIEKIMDEQYQANVEIQGSSAYTRNGN